MEAKKRAFDHHREARQHRASHWARTRAPRFWFKERSASPTESASLFHPDDGQGHGLGCVALFGIAGDEGNRQS
jgi:hypothetical protein